MAGIGMRESKKFAVGTIHENGGGRFEILDRFLEDNVIMLKIKYLNSGEEEVNKEVNINASIWKFQKVRGLTPSTVKKNTLGDLLTSSIEELRDSVAQINAEHENMFSRFDTIVELLDKLVQEQERYTNTLRERMKTNELLEGRLAESQRISLSAQEALSKALDKIK